MWCRYREFCVYLHCEGHAPATWQRGIDAQITVEFHHWMRTQCFELQLCEDNWKADKLAILANYSQWKKKYEARLARYAAKAKAAKKAKAAAKKKAGKGKERALEEDMSADEEDWEFQQDLAGAAKVRDVLAATQFCVSPAPGDEAALGTPGPSRRSPSPGPSDDEPASKRQRTHGPSPTTSLSLAPSPPLPADTLHAPGVPPDTGLVPTVGETEGTSAAKPKIKFRNPLADMEWPAAEPTAATRNSSAPQPAALPPPPPALPAASSSASSPSVASELADAVPALSIIGPVSSSSATLSSATSSGIASVSPPNAPTPEQLEASTGDGAESKKRVPWPRKVTSWPPPDNQDHAKPKDICVRVWARNHPDGTREDYDLWYRRMRPYYRQLYAATNGARGDEPETNSAPTTSKTAPA
ncbi:hypothetical protein VTO73DRAFT_5255 [Trametes versicolor]